MCGKNKRRSEIEEKIELEAVKEVEVIPVNVTAEDVKKYLCPAATDKEIFMFINLCKYQRLNPWIREAYLVKYGTQPATIITGKEAFMKRAQHNPRYAGHKAWTTGTVPQLTATAEVFVRGYQVPISVIVDYNEYVGKKADGKPNRMWATKPKTMLRKVALVQALREAFPDDFGGMYSPEEINTVDMDKLPCGNVRKEELQEPMSTEELSLAHDSQENVAEAEKEIVDKDQKKKEPSKPEPAKNGILLGRIEEYREELNDDKMFFSILGAGFGCETVEELSLKDRAEFTTRIARTIKDLEKNG